MIILNKIGKEFGDKVLFKDVDLSIYDGEKIGVVGDNGSGKSTFMKILSGKLSPDDGSVEIFGSLNYVPQIAEKIDYKNSSMEEFIDFLKSNKQLDFSNKLSQEFDSLSGGEKTKLMLSFAFSRNVDIILLDEPTNNLDEDAIDWLIEKVNSFPGTLVIISHDRYFLNKTVNSIIEIENGKLQTFYGNYDDYQTQKQEKLDYDKKIYQSKLEFNNKIKKQIAKINEFAAKLEKSSKRDGSSDKRSIGYKESVQSKMKKLSKQADAKKTRLEKLEKDLGERPYEKGEIFYRVEGQLSSSKLMIKFKDVAKAFEENLLFSNVDFCIEKGEKIALLGGNGTGKTTLIKLLLGEEDYEGEIWKSSNLKIAYLPQNAFDLNIDMNILEFSEKFDKYRTQFLTNLCNMGLKRQMFNTKISKLSAGEKMKIKLNELILGNFNLLILDEPTNNLDIENKKFLESALKNYKGNLLIVSHDKTLINNICDSKLEIKNKKVLKSYLSNS